MNINKYNWGEALKVELENLPTESSNTGGEKKALPPIEPGRYAAFVQEVKHGTFKTGSYGVTFKYVIEGGPFKNRKVTDNLVLTKSDGTAVKYADSRLKRALMAFGLPLEKINAFKGPRNEHDLGDFRLAIGAPVTIIVKDDGDYNGRPSRKVVGTYIRTVADEVAA